MPLTRRVICITCADCECRLRCLLLAEEEALLRVQTCAVWSPVSPPLGCERGKKAGAGLSPRALKAREKAGGALHKSPETSRLVRGSHS